MWEVTVILQASEARGPVSRRTELDPAERVLPEPGRVKISG